MEPHVPRGALMSRRTNRSLLAVALVLVLLIAVPPFINVSRYRGRISNSISRALGRPVTVGNISLRVFPQPGLDLTSLIIGEDPAFGTEPMLRADEVTATLRLTSLWRGRLEIAKLSLKYPSLNLVRAANGRWNIESLLEHTSQIPSAPTVKTRPEARPRFPYIQAQSGRINFKFGQEKKVFAFTDTDFALWLASENEWRMRLEGRPVRNDAYLSDTGTLRIEGRFHRAANLRDTPLEVTVGLDRGQLGQLTSLLYGRDRGWRGNLELQAKLSGTPAAMDVRLESSVDEFRRYDINNIERFGLNSQCAAKFSTTTDTLSDIACRVPFGRGLMMLSGQVQGLLEPRDYQLTLIAQSIPVQTLVSFGRHAKKDIPDDLAASGSFDAAITLTRGANGAQWTGNGSTSPVVLRSNVLAPNLSLGSLHFALQDPAGAQASSKPSDSRVPRPNDEVRLAIEPFALAMGATQRATAAAWFSRTAYSITVKGDTQIPRLVQVGRALGLPATDINANGVAKVDFATTGTWAGLTAPRTTGTAQLQNLSADITGVNAPLHITSATLTLGPDGAALRNFNVSFIGTKVGFSGSAEIPRGCASIETCPIQFDLKVDQISSDDLNRLFNPRMAKRPWYDILSGSAGSLLTRMKAHGQIAANRFSIRTLVANRVSTTAEFNNGIVSLTNFRGDVLGGKHQGTWKADFTGNSPVFSGTGTIDSVALAQLASLMKDNWATGTAKVSYTARMTGIAPDELARSATGAINFDWRGGSLRHVVLASANGKNGSGTSLAFRHWAGALELKAGVWTVAPSKMDVNSGIYQVSGTASLGKELQFTLTNGSRAFSVTGTLDKPKVAPVNLPEQVSLKQ
jgi:hypothetical protein